VSARREVRVSASFFAELDAQLGADRGPAGQPSATDFIVADLPQIVEHFAAEFDELPEATTGVPAIRMFIGSGALVAAFVVHGIETSEGVVDLVGVEVDP
jgi:hypothetical protein